MREELGAYHEELEAAKEALGAAPETNSGILNPLRVQAQSDLARAEVDMRKAEDRLRQAEAAAVKLSDALRTLGGVDIAPEISSDSIDRALEKVRELFDGLQSLPSSSTSTVPAAKPAAARAFGGPAQAGLPYLVNEHTPRSEWFVPSASGGVLNVSQAKSAFRSHLSAMGPRPLARLQRGAQGLRAAIRTSGLLPMPCQLVSQ